MTSSHAPADAMPRAIEEQAPAPRTARPKRFMAWLNGPGHKGALQAFMLVVVLHLAEHLVQAYQVYLLGWPRPESRGMLGQVFPWLVHAEILHYGYAVVMLAGIWMLLPAFVGRARTWWLVALAIQFWHHIEHALLQGQAIADQNLFGSPVPLSIVQLWIPRVELHLLYNALVFVPMVVAVYLHMFPNASESAAMSCRCALRARTLTA